MRIPHQKGGIKTDSLIRRSDREIRMMEINVKGEKR